MTMITTTYPIPDVEAPIPAVADRRAWGFWATLGWFGAAIASHFAVAILFGLGFAIWWIVAHGNMDVGTEPPAFESITLVFAMLAPALLLTLAARHAGPSAKDYLGLTIPAKRYILIGLGLTAAFWCVSEVSDYLFPAFNQTPELVREYRAVMGNPLALTMFWITVLVSAPVFEEIIFRGFLMRGWSESRLGAMGAIMLSSLAFAAIHTQYNLYNMGFVLGLGLVLGVMRWRSGSTTLTIMLHAAWNLATGITVVLQA
jgi:CAAX protease family protein